jgi:predicted dehydrogenase
MYHFAKCVADDEKIEPLGATFLDGYRNCQIMDGIAESAKTGRWVKLTN